MKLEKATPVIPMQMCEFAKEQKILKLTSEPFGMPAKFYVQSNHTGRKILFTAVQPGDPLWDEDGWDGEQCIYRPTEDVKNVAYMVIYNAW